MGFMALADKGEPPTLSVGQDPRFLVRASQLAWEEGGMFFPVRPKERTQWPGSSSGILALAADFSSPWSI